MRYEGNGSRRPDEILAEIDRTRGELDSTLSAIEHRLTPGQLVDQGLDYLRHSGGTEFVRNLGTSAKQNPLPVALVGIGLAWLMATNRNPRHHSEMDRVSGTAQAARDRASQIGESARHLGQAARQQVQRARSNVDYLVNEQPLALGAIGLAIGAVLAAAVPRTRQEAELMGETSERLAKKATEAGAEKAKQVVETAKEAMSGQQAQEPDGSTRVSEQSFAPHGATASLDTRPPAQANPYAPPKSAADGQKQPASRSYPPSPGRGTPRRPG